MLFKMSFSDAISISEDEHIYTSEYFSEYSSVLGIRVGVPHLTKFDVGRIRYWGVVLMCSMPRGGIDAPDQIMQYSFAVNPAAGRRVRFHLCSPWTRRPMLWLRGTKTLS